MNFARTGWDMMQRHNGGDIDATQVDYPRMVWKAD